MKKMRVIYHSLLIAILCGGVFPSVVSAYFQDLGTGVRPIGMGEAFTAVADDSNTVLWNSAGLADLKRREINVTYSDLFSNLNARLYTGENDYMGLHNVGMILPFAPNLGSFGFFWTLFNTKFYKENVFILSYGREVGSELFQFLNIQETMRNIKLNGGINLKVMNWRVVGNEYTNENPVLDPDDLSRTGFTADLGLLATTPGNLKFGLALENFIPANVGVTIYETIPMNFRLGVSYLYDWQGSIPYIDTLLGTMDFTHRNGISDIRAGAEGWFLKQLVGLRIGTTADQFTTGASFGFGIKKSNLDLRLDYAFAYPYGIQATWGSHRFSVIVRWGTLAAAEVKKLKLPVEVAKPEETLADKREQELAAERAKEEAKLKAMMSQLRVEIKQARVELKRVTEMIKLDRIPAIQFQSGKTVLQRKSFITLDEIGVILKKYPRIKVRLEGHTDSVGKEAYNQKLSQGRVESIKEYLMGKHALTAANLIPVGYGESRPIASNKTSQGRSSNRRVGFKVLLPFGMVNPGVDSEQEQKADTESPKNRVRPEDIVSYEELDKLREKMKIYKMQMNTKEIEKMFNQQHRENAETLSQP